MSVLQFILVLITILPIQHSGDSALNGFSSSDAMAGSMYTEQALHSIDTSAALNIAALFNDNENWPKLYTGPLVYSSSDGQFYYRHLGRTVWMPHMLPQTPANP